MKRGLVLEGSRGGSRWGKRLGIENPDERDGDPHYFSHMRRAGGGSRPAIDLEVELRHWGGRCATTFGTATRNSPPKNPTLNFDTAFHAAGQERQI